MAVTRQNKKAPSGSPMIDPKEILSLPPEQVMARLETSVSGLSAEEAENRLETYGTDEIARGGKRSVILEFLSHFRAPVTIILIVAAIISGVVGDTANMVIIIIIVLVSVILDFTQEYPRRQGRRGFSAKSGFDRDCSPGRRKTGNTAATLVPGDVINLSAGDVVPADARVIAVNDFFVDQSALTGESFPVEKTIEAIPQADAEDTTRWNNYAFLGTSVTNGTATAVIAATGGSTQFGEIARKSMERKPETEFEAACVNSATSSYRSPLFWLSLYF